ncbi:MAG: CBS domain-containing protein, partial [Gammaproteobacteria bacterium]|nr:CBS domain-containing protein [Gammaproteobacteria bacterium]
GFLHSEDMLRLTRGTRGGGDLASATLDSIIKPAHFVPPTKKVDEMFDYFQRNNTRVAIILGEYGEVLGIVTMKDVVKFIFGEISGRMVGQEYYNVQDENSYIVPGEMRLTDFYNLTNFDIGDKVMTTIGGVAFRLFDSLPKVGDMVTHDGYQFIAQEVKGLRISKIQVSKIALRDQHKQGEQALISEAPIVEQETPEEIESATQQKTEGPVEQETGTGGEIGNESAVSEQVDELPAQQPDKDRRVE